MIDPETAKNTALVGAGAYLAKDLLKQALGPTADYIGDGLKKFTAKRVENIERILSKFINKLGQKINEPGQVHPKLLKGLISDGSFCDDELTAEYYGGVLASSRIGVSRDDRGETYWDQVSHLSTYQVRTHFIVYTVFRKLYLGWVLDKPQPDLVNYHYTMKVYIPISDYERAMSFVEDSEDSAFAKSCTLHSLTGLQRNGLIDDVYISDAHDLKSRFSGITFPENGILFDPTVAGIELYLWGTGHGDIDVESFLTSDIEIKIPDGLKVPTKAFNPSDEYRRQKLIANSKTHTNGQED